jgi:hypothetical protein
MAYKSRNLGHGRSFHHVPVQMDIKKKKEKMAEIKVCIGHHPRHTRQYYDDLLISSSLSWDLAS